MSSQHTQKKPRVSLRPDREEVQQLLDRMARAVTAGDGRTVATMWETPALVVGDDEVMAVASPQEVEKFFGGAREQYNARGIIDTRAEIVRHEQITDLIDLVEVRWPYLDAKGEERGEETSTYILRRDDAGDLKLRVAVMHGASEG
jgi:ketosteroid isomerase-like protein